MNARCSPKGIGRTHLPNELTNFTSHCGSPNCPAPTFPSPIQPESFAMPSDHTLWLHDEQRRAPIPPKAGKANPKHAVRRVKTKPAAHRLFQDCELVTESQHLDLNRPPNPKPRLRTGKRGKKERGKHRAARSTRALGKINDCSSTEIFGRHNTKAFAQNSAEIAPRGKRECGDICWPW